MKRVIIGSANFGNGYGLLDNSVGITATEALAILDFSSECNIDSVDTAPSYGTAEEIVGTYSGRRLNVSTKVFIHDSDSAAQSIRNSIRTLKNHSLEVVFIHDWFQATDWDKENFLKVSEGRREWKLGVSIYTHEEIDQEMFSRANIEVVQLPLNILDQRFVPDIEEFQKQGIEVWGRSVFLQGMLTADPGNRFRNDPRLTAIFELAKEYKIPVSELATQFALQSQLDAVVVGFRSKVELSKFASINRNHCLPKIDFREFASNDIELIDPRRWARN